MSRFDWYAASYRGSHDLALAAICGNLGGEVVETGRGHHGFERAARVRGDGGLHAYLQWAGAQHGDLVHVSGTGARSGEVAAVLREFVPEHRVSRVDVCEDILGPSVFDALDTVTRSIAEVHRVSRHRLIPDDSDKGATINIGSRQSSVYARVYEKGKQILSDPSKGRDVVPPPGYQTIDDLLSWVRCEIEIKPKGPARTVLASASPDSLWGCSRWSSALYEALGGVPGDRIQVGTVWRQDDTERAIKAMATQYRRYLLQLRDDLGDWACVGLQLGQIIADLSQLGGAGASSAPHEHGGE